MLQIGSAHKAVRTSLCRHSEKYKCPAKCVITAVPFQKPVVFLSGSVFLLCSFLVSKNRNRETTKRAFVREE